MSFALYCPTCSPEKFVGWTEEEKFGWCFSDGRHLTCIGKAHHKQPAGKVVMPKTDGPTISSINIAQILTEDLGKEDLVWGPAVPCSGPFPCRNVGTTDENGDYDLVGVKDMVPIPAGYEGPAFCSILCAVHAGAMTLRDKKDEARV